MDQIPEASLIITTFQMFYILANTSPTPCRYDYVTFPVHLLLTYDSIR